VIASIGTPPSFNFSSEVHSILAMVRFTSSTGVPIVITMFLRTAYSAILFSIVTQGKKIAFSWGFGQLNYLHFQAVGAHLFLAYGLFFRKVELLG